MSSDETRRPRRPGRLDPGAAEAIGGEPDPAERTDTAHATAHALVHRGRASDDPRVVERLVTLVDDEGLGTIAALWSDSPADTLPGVLWRLYALRTWVRADARVVADRYRQGVTAAPVHDVVAGVAQLPTAADMEHLVDQVLTGVYTRDLDVALERAAAFCRVVATGTAFDADHLDTLDSVSADRATRSAAGLLRTADELTHAAGLWRQGRLE
ncbi:MAG: hypothetical protein FWF02_00045 [Micrococcales bacterium]|nr:hypothetical protein [Micrococcales bacterium]MCL2666089.1 hypothetical protein [Micrococcales bacterium]